MSTLFCAAYGWYACTNSNIGKNRTVVSDCTSYMTCDSDKNLVKMSCGSEYFNCISNKCGPKKNMACCAATDIVSHAQKVANGVKNFFNKLMGKTVAIATVAPTSQCPKEGYLWASIENCTNFYMCVAGVPQLYTCAAGELLVIELVGFLIWDVKCSKRRKTTRHVLLCTRENFFTVIFSCSFANFEAIL